MKQVKVLSSVTKSSNWNHIKEFISWCEKSCHTKKDNLTESLCQYIGKSYFKFEHLEDYPDDWNNEKKGKYLMSLVATNHDDIRRILRNAEIDWPYEKTSRIYDNLPKLIQKILDWEEVENDRKYETLDRMSYIILLRNLYKHYDKLSPEIKVLKISIALGL